MPRPIGPRGHYRGATEVVPVPRREARSSRRAERALVPERRGPEDPRETLARNLSVAHREFAFLKMSLDFRASKSSLGALQRFFQEELENASSQLREFLDLPPTKLVRHLLVHYLVENYLKQLKLEDLIERLETHYPQHPNYVFGNPYR